MCSLGKPLIALEALRELRDLLCALHDAPKCGKASLKPPKEGAYEKKHEA
jgi:hypothetical protein